MMLDRLLNDGIILQDAQEEEDTIIRLISREERSEADITSTVFMMLGNPPRKHENIITYTLIFRAVIGIIAAICTGLGVQIGKKVSASSHIGNYADAVGGVVLIGIGMKILHQHGVLAALLQK